MPRSLTLFLRFILSRMATAARYISPVSFIRAGKVACLVKVLKSVYLTVRVTLLPL